MDPVRAEYYPQGTAVQVVILAVLGSGVAYGYHVADGKPFIGDWQRLKFKVDAESAADPDEPTKPLVWGEWLPQRHLPGFVRFSDDGLDRQTISESGDANNAYDWCERIDDKHSRTRDGFKSAEAAREACEAFSAERGDKQPHRVSP